MPAPLLLPLLFFFTALTYASVGFAGGSTYLALLVLFDVPYASLPKVALICNLIVASGGLYHYIRAGHLKIGRLLPFVITSIPLAYVGGSTPIGKRPFLICLGISLAAAGLRLFFQSNTVQEQKIRFTKTMWGIGLPVGMVIGFFSGLVGIGGGIFLSPILYFLRWGNPRQIAAAASFFICVNSAAGLLGQLTKGLLTSEGGWMLPLIVAVFIGGQVGSRLSTGTIPLIGLQRGTALLILFIAAKIFWGLL